MTTRYYTYKRQVILGANQVVKFLKGKGYYAAAAAAVIIGGGVIGGVTGGGGSGCTNAALGCVTASVGTTTTTPGGTLGGVTTANLWLTAPSDSTSGQVCTRSSSVSYATAFAANHTCPATSQFLDTAVGAASMGDTIGVPGGKYFAISKQIISYRSGLNNKGCDPLGTWGAVNTTNCIRFAPASGAQVYFNNDIENHSSDIWWDGSYTGTVTDRSARTYSFKFASYAVENDDSPSGTPVDHDIATGMWVQWEHISGCHFCQYSQMQNGPRIHVEEIGCNNNQDDFATVDGTDGSSWPVNPSDATHLPSVGVPTGYNGSGNETNFSSRNGADDANIVVDNTYFYYTNNASGTQCDPHDGGMFLRGGIDSMLLSDNIWTQNMIYDIQVQDITGLPNNGLTIQNNWFGSPVDTMRSALAGSTGCPGVGCNGPGGDLETFGPAIQVDAAASSWIVRYNSFGQGQLDMNFSGLAGGCGSGVFPSWQVYGNAGTLATCNGGSCSSASGTTFAYNVWDGGTCGATDATATIANVFNNTGVGTTLNYALKGGNGSTTADNFVPSGALTPAGLGAINASSRGNAPYDAGSYTR